MHHNNLFFSFLSILNVFIYIIPLAFLLFTIWFALKFLKLQERKNAILQSIAERLDKQK
ncbi:hypothetical protein [Sporosarcina sp. P16b]|uniref:hypothetical protein n=1 Tax=Sporosarcina sp. P16b TaxID=2048261 RepID=UPI0018EDC23D|nr:hypothetical protein [Sporosarcina sp. P16b]